MHQPLRWPAIVVGIVVALIGLILGIGGAWLAAIGGSPYYLITGAAMLVAGVLLVRGRIAGGWLYCAIVALTVLWAWWEVGADAWGLVPRVVAPVVLLVAVVLAMAALSSRPRRLAWGGGAAVAIVAATALGFVLVASDAQPVGALPAPGSRGMRDASPLAVGADWPAYGGTYAARRYSPLAEINPDNVGRLERVWVAHTGDLPTQASERDKFGAETTPLKVGNRLYLCSATNKMMALDAANGDTLWEYDPNVRAEWIPYTAACRGVAYYEVPDAAEGQACAARVIEGTLDGRLIAVDATTGQPCEGFGDRGAADIKQGLGPVVPGMVAITAAPTIVDGTIVTGHEVLDGQTTEAPSGVIEGFDAVTGRLKWAWDMTHPEWTGAPPAGQTWTRGSPNSWTGFSADEQLGLVYVPMGNAGVDYVSGYRTMPMKEFASSLVALDAATGRPRWRFQAVRNDVWDYDLGAQGTLVDWPADGGDIPAIVLPSKQGDIYVLDRRTGRPLTPVGLLKAPEGGVEPSERAPTQRVSLWHTLRQPRLTERDMWGMSPIDQMVCRIQYRRASYDGFFTPPTADKRWIEYPGYNGGTDWGGIAVDPARGVIVANYNDMPNYNRLIPRAVANRKGWAPRGDARGGSMGAGAEGAGDPQAGTPYAIDVNAGWRLPFTGMLCKEPPYGGIRAIDMRTGKTIWDRPLGTARRNGPFGIASRLPFTIGTPNNGGAVVTAGGVVFVAAATDDLIRAIDLKTGKTLWTDTLPAGGQATPMTYEANGRQYVVIMAGGHHFMETPIGDELIAYALPNHV